MTVTVVGGPYDGYTILATDIRRHTTVLVLKTQTSTWRFVYLPTPDDWQAVLDGRMSVDDSKEYHYYQLLDTPEGPQLRFDPSGQSYQRVIQEAIGDMPNRDGQF